jgi:hypothetical protein
VFRKAVNIVTIILHRPDDFTIFGINNPAIGKQVLGVFAAAPHGGNLQFGSF